MGSGSEEWSEAAPSDDHDTNSESPQEDYNDVPITQARFHQQAEIDRIRWTECLDWKQAREMNERFFKGEHVSTHIGAEFNPAHKHNKNLASISKHFYVVSYNALLESRDSQSDGSITETRRMGDCCFMVPGKYPGLQQLIYALLVENNLSTSMVHMSFPDLRDSFRTNFEDPYSEIETRNRTTLDDYEPWHPLRSISQRAAWQRLSEVANIVAKFGCNAISDARPVIFWIQAREDVTDVLERLSQILHVEIERSGPMLYCEQFRVPRDKF